MYARTRGGSQSASGYTQLRQSGHVMTYQDMSECVRIHLDCRHLHECRDTVGYVTIYLDTSKCTHIHQDTSAQVTISVFRSPTALASQFSSSLLSFHTSTASHISVSLGCPDVTDAPSSRDPIISLSSRSSVLTLKGQRTVVKQEGAFSFTGLTLGCSHSFKCKNSTLKSV